VFEETCQPIPPTENRTLSDRAIGPVGEKAAGCQMLVVSLPNPDSGASLQVLPTLEAPAEDSVG